MNPKILNALEEFYNRSYSIRPNEPKFKDLTTSQLENLRNSFAFKSYKRHQDIYGLKAILHDMLQKIKLKFR